MPPPPPPCSSSSSFAPSLVSTPSPPRKNNEGTPLESMQMRFKRTETFFFFEKGSHIGKRYRAPPKKWKGEKGGVVGLWHISAPEGKNHSALIGMRVTIFRKPRPNKIHIFDGRENVLSERTGVQKHGSCHSAGKRKEQEDRVFFHSSSVAAHLAREEEKKRLIRANFRQAASTESAFLPPPPSLPPSLSQPSPPSTQLSKLARLALPLVLLPFSIVCSADTFFALRYTTTVQALRLAAWLVGWGGKAATFNEP